MYRSTPWYWFLAHAGRKKIADVGAADAIALVFAPRAVPAPGSAAIGQLLRMEQVIRFSDDTHDVKDQYFTLADGNGTRWLAHRYAYQRRAVSTGRRQGAGLAMMAAVALLGFSGGQASAQQIVERFPSSGSAPAGIVEKGAPAPRGRDAHPQRPDGVPVPQRRIAPCRLTCHPRRSARTKTRRQSRSLTRSGRRSGAVAMPWPYVVKLTVYLVGDPANGGGMDYAGMNERYRQFFGTSENRNWWRSQRFRWWRSPNRPSSSKLRRRLNACPRNDDRSRFAGQPRASIQRDSSLPLYKHLLDIRQRPGLVEQRLVGR